MFSAAASPGSIADQPMLQQTASALARLRNNALAALAVLLFAQFTTLLPAPLVCIHLLLHGPEDPHALEFSSASCYLELCMLGILGWNVLQSTYALQYLPTSHGPLDKPEMSIQGTLSILGPPIEDSPVEDPPPINCNEFTTGMAPCRVCGVASAKRCSLCHKVHYCSPEHIASDWPLHRANCYVRPPTNASGRTMDHEVVGILFPVDEDAPRTIKVKCLGGYTNSGQWWQTRNLRPYIPDDEKKGRGHVRMDGPLVPAEGGISIGTMAEIFFRSGFLEDGSTPNRCIQHLTKGKMAQPWAGPFIAFRRTHMDTSIDAVMEQDLPVLIQYFTTQKR